MKKGKIVKLNSNIHTTLTENGSMITILEQSDVKNILMISSLNTYGQSQQFRIYKENLGSLIDLLKSFKDKNKHIRKIL